jgi:hypothetical protein
MRWALAAIGSGAPGSLFARANSTPIVVYARAASTILVVSAGFIPHLWLIHTHVFRLTTMRDMVVVNRNPISEHCQDQPMDVDNDDDASLGLTGSKKASAAPNKFAQCHKLMFENTGGAATTTCGIPLVPGQSNEALRAAVRAQTLDWVSTTPILCGSQPADHSKQAAHVMKLYPRHRRPGPTTMPVDENNGIQAK